MTIMGAKRNTNEPRKPMKRSYIKRKASFKPSHSSLKARTCGKTGRYKAQAYEAFMRQFRGLPSIVSGRTHSQFLKDDNGRLLKTDPHHILPKSVYPEYRHTKENIAVLTREEHSYAEDNPNKFTEWLRNNRPEVFAWAEQHRHHRGETQ